MENATMWQHNYSLKQYMETFVECIGLYDTVSKQL